MRNRFIFFSAETRFGQFKATSHHFLHNTCTLLAPGFGVILNRLMILDVNWSDQEVYNKFNEVYNKFNEVYNKFHEVYNNLIIFDISCMINRLNFYSCSRLFRRQRRMEIMVGLFLCYYRFIRTLKLSVLFTLILFYSEYFVLL